MNETVILACECGQVALLEGPAKPQHTPIHWQQAAPALCPKCLNQSLADSPRKARRTCEPMPAAT